MIDRYLVDSINDSIIQNVKGGNYCIGEKHRIKSESVMTTGYRLFSFLLLL